jgi:hypothetical protein
MERMDDKLDGLWAAYRDACPDPDPGAEFMPGLWQKIEARRTATVSVFRRLSQVCVMATVALTLLMGVVLIPRLQRQPVYTSTYVDVLSAEHSTDYVDILAGSVR